MENSRKYALIATVLAAIIWSTGGLLIKLLPQSAFTILFYRSLYAGLLFLAVFRRRALRVNKLSLAASAFYCVLLIAFVSATKLTTAANAIFLQYTAIAFVLLIEPKLLKVPIRPINIFTVIASMLGMSLFFVDQFATDNWLGIGIASISGIALAGFVLCQRLNSPDYQENSILLGNLWVILAVSPFVYDQLGGTAYEHGLMAFLGFIQIGVGYMLFTYGQKILSALESSLIALLEPILNPIWVLIGYGEQPSIFALIGGSMIILALLIRMLYLEYHNKKVAV